tara:strand:+ start:3169 stop:4203 length:1035 start_codon:yes stop_codon:yes gene_type:complete
MVLFEEILKKREGQNWTGREFITYGGNNKTYGDIFGNRFLDQRSRIEFHYPGGWGESGEDIITFIPFYENPEIKESQTANYVEYNPIGRGGSLFAYTGTKSRKFKVSLTFTLPHLAMHPMGIERFMRVFVGASKESKKLLFTVWSNYSNVANVGDVSHSLAAEVASIYDKLLDERYTRDLQTIATDGRSQTPAEALASDALFADAAFKNLSFSNNKEFNEVVDTLLFFIAVLRTSVVNKVTNPMQGPPLLRLNFGTLYQSVPCICKNYNLSWEEKAGYDLATLTPRRIKIDLTLDEVRVGSGMKYEPGNFSKRDGLTGWESAIASPYTTDPLNLGGSFGESGAN